MLQDLFLGKTLSTVLVMHLLTGKQFSGTLIDANWNEQLSLLDNNDVHE